MSMDAHTGETGHLQIFIGTFGKWSLSLITLGLTGMLGWLCISTVQLVRQQAVMASEIVALNNNVSGVPMALRQIAEMRVQLNRNTNDLYDLTHQQQGRHKPQQNYEYSDRQ